MTMQDTSQWQQEHFRLFLQHRTDVVELLDTDGTIIHTSEALPYVLGYQPEERIKTNILSYIHPDDYAYVQKQLQALLQSPATPVHAEYRIRHKNGSWIWVEATSSNHLHTSGIQGIVSIFRDIAQRKRIEEEKQQLLLREQAAQAEAEIARRRLHDLLMQVPAAICLLRGPQHIYEFANPRYLQIISQRNPIGKPVRDVLPAVAGQDIIKTLDHVYTTGEPFIGNEMKIALDHHHDGRLVDTYFNVVYQPSRDAHGTVEGIMVHAVDVTEQVQARQQIQESETRLQRLVNSNIIGVSFTNLNGSITGANDSFLRMLGYTREDLDAGRLNWTTMTAPEYAARDKAALQEIQRYGAVSSPYEKVYISKGGNRVPVLVGGAFTDATRGEFVNFTIDMRAQKHMEEELRGAKEQLEAILQNVADGITVQNVTGSLIYVNDVAAMMCGFPSAAAMLATPRERMRELLGKFVIKDEAGNTLSFQDLPGRQALISKKNVQMLIQYTHPQTGHTHWSLVKSQPIFYEGEQAQFAVNVLTDLSERQALEQRKNEFISMASHELKTPVTALKGFTHVLQRRTAQYGDEQTMRYLLRMDAQLNKLTKLINDLLDISKIQAGKLAFQEETVDLAALVHEIVENVQDTTATHQLAIEETADAHITGDKDRLGQVLINLLTNAIKYSPDANKVIVRVTTDEQRAIVHVQDFGIGIGEVYHQKIFERFYQVTDPEEKTFPGLGIGLYISHEIIARHRGTIWVDSGKGKGSTFSFSLPLSKTLAEKRVE